VRLSSLLELASSDVLVVSCVALETAVAVVLCVFDVAADPTAVDVPFVHIFSMFLASLLLLAFLRLLASLLLLAFQI
jgi:hypothetical protein